MGWGWWRGRCTYSWVAEGAFCDGLEKGGFADICETDLAIAIDQYALRIYIRVEARTMPLFRLLPGRPKSTFFSSSFFFGGIFFLHQALDVENSRTKTWVCFCGVKTVD